MKLVNQSLVVCAFLMLSFLTFGQTTVTVKSIFNLGGHDFAYVFDENQSQFYKTTAYPTGLLSFGQQISMEYLDSKVDFDGRILKEGNSIYAQIVKTESFNLPLEANYGMPVYENEILFFQNKEHLDEFSEILRAFVDSQYEDMYDLLQVFESEFPNFVSLNDRFENEFGVSRKGTTSRLFDQYVREDFIVDYIFKSLLNEHYEIGIGENVLVNFYDEEIGNIITAQLDKEELNNIDFYRGVSKIKVPQGLTLLNDNVFVGSVQIEKSSVWYPLVQDADHYKLEYSDFATPGVINCSILDKKLTYYMERVIEVDGESLLTPSLFAATVTIDWGDGSPITTFSYDSDDLDDHLDLNYSTRDYINVLYHTYPAEGDYVAKITTTLTDERTGMSTTVPMEPNFVTIEVGEVCTDQYDTHTEKKFFDGSHILIAATSAITSSIFADQKVQGYIVNYQWDDADAKYYKRNADELKITLHGLFRNPATCNYSDEKERDKHRTNHKDINKRMWKSGSVHRTEEDSWAKYYWSDYGISWSYTYYFYGCE